MLRKRLIASFLMVCPVLAVFWLDSNYNFGLPGIWAIPLIVTFSVVIVSELLAMIRDRTPGANVWVAYAGTLLCQFAVLMPEIWTSQIGTSTSLHRWGWSVMALAVTVLAAFLVEMRQFTPERQSTTRVALTLLVVMYAGWMLSFLSAMRIELGNYEGGVALFSVLFIIKLSDVGAYFAGKNLGRHKLAPVLSPGKTIEGLWGGLLAAVVAAIIVFAFIMPSVVDVAKTNWLAVVGYGLSIAIVGVLGDLSESMIKRDMQCKDSSGWLPGLGGIMDTADSIVLAAPIAYVWWSTGWLSG